ncbi:MAG TPA: nucleotide sugar dehydrogenase [Candidatus Nanoarchaeia archaeon]|nr:nucleotide sugar dehydrogenase [Candidatus Nanoarchaeia archaeon]
MKSVCIIGLGYVGMPLAELCAQKGYDVVGYDILEKKSRIKTTTDPSCIKEADIVVMCVPTPVDERHNPDYGPVQKAAESISTFMKQGQLVIIESTLNPGATEEVIKPILDESGKRYNLAYCPERIDPGNKEFTLTKIPRVIGGIDAESLQLAKKFYASILDSPIKEMSSIRAAEAVKIVENTFRDVNIAFVNELAKGFDSIGLDVIEVIQGASTKPFSFIPHFPSCGVGGHCIPVDPYYLIRNPGKNGFDYKFLKLAREINEGMPAYTVKKALEAITEKGKNAKDVKISVLGLAYKGNVPDIRESPSFEIIHELRKLGVEPLVFDPHVPEKSNCSFEEALRSDVLIFASNHDEFRQIDFSKMKDKIVIDGKNFLKIEDGSITYKGIGR